MSAFSAALPVYRSADQFAMPPRQRVRSIVITPTFCPILLALRAFLKSRNNTKIGITSYILTSGQLYINCFNARKLCSWPNSARASKMMSSSWRWNFKFKMESSQSREPGRLILLNSTNASNSNDPTPVL